MYICHVFFLELEAKLNALRITLVLQANPCIKDLVPILCEQ